MRLPYCPSSGTQSSAGNGGGMFAQKPLSVSFTGVRFTRRSAQQSLGVNNFSLLKRCGTNSLYRIFWAFIKKRRMLPETVVEPRSDRSGASSVCQASLRNIAEFTK